MFQKNNREFGIYCNRVVIFDFWINVKITKKKKKIPKICFLFFFYSIVVLSLLVNLIGGLYLMNLVTH